MATKTGFARKRVLKLVSPGKQKNGQTVTLKHISEAVNNHKDDARPPVTLGHPSKGDDRLAAYGRVAKPRIQQVDGSDSLVVDILYTPTLAKHEDNGEFEGFSGGLHPDPETNEMYIHHVAALGLLPGAADTKTLEVVELAAIQQGDLICLAAEVIGTSTGDIELDAEELKKLISDGTKAAVEEATKPLLERLEKVEGGTSDNPPVTQPKGDPQADATTPPQAENKELSAVLNVMKDDRIAVVKAEGKKKGLSEDQLKPWLSQLEKASPVELANNNPDGLFQSSLTFIKGLDDKDDSHLSRPLELSNAVDSKGAPLDMDSLAACM